MEQLPEEIRRVASELDNAIEANDLERVVQCFSDDCEIQMSDVRLTGKEGVGRWLRLYFDRLDFAKVAAKGFLAQAVVHRLADEFMKGL